MEWPQFLLFPVIYLPIVNEKETKLIKVLEHIYFLSSYFSKKKFYIIN